MSGFSYQLYSSRKFPPLADTLAMVAEAGYGRVEGYGALYGNPPDASGLGDMLASAGLHMATSHIGLDMLETAPDQVLAIARSLDMEGVIVPFIQPQDRPTDSAGWRAFGRRLEEAGAPVRDAGLTFAYHNHAFEFEATPTGEIPMALLFEGAPSLQWEMDVAWVVRGGADPIAWITDYSDRIFAAHVKDIAADGENTDEDGWADVGHGTMDWSSIMAALGKTPCRFFVMEHDNPSDDRRFATRSIAAATAFGKENT